MNPQWFNKSLKVVTMFTALIVLSGCNPEKKSTNADAGNSVTQSASKTEATSNQIIDIKGLKIGMPIQEAKDIIKQNLDSGKSCTDTDGESGEGISPSMEGYTIGQKVTSCDQNFKFFGGLASLYATYVDDRLFYLRMGQVSTPSPGDTKSGLTLYKALAEKFNVKPEIVKKRGKEEQEIQFPGEGKSRKIRLIEEGSFKFNYESAFTDPQGNILRLSGDIIENGAGQESSGFGVFDHTTIELYSSQFISFKKSREQNMKSLENQKAQEAEQKKKSDL